MSDGPHRSLPMRKGWQRVAERADNENFEAADVTKCVTTALEQDSVEEMSPEFINALTDICQRLEGTLFPPNLTAEIEALSPKAGYGIGKIFLDNLVQLSANDKSQAEIIVNAMDAALKIRGASCARQTEEHYFRKSTVPRALNVRARLEQAIEATPTRELARRLLRLDEGRTERPTLKRGLDDGVRL